MRGQLEHPAAQEIVRMPPHRPRDRKCPVGVGVLGLPTTVLIVRTGLPALNRVSVRRCLDMSMRHWVRLTTTRLALIQPAELLGRQGSRTRTRAPILSARGPARTNSQGAASGPTQVDACSLSGQTVEHLDPRLEAAFQAKLLVGAPTGALPRTPRRQYSRQHYARRLPGSWQRRLRPAPPPRKQIPRRPLPRCAMHSPHRRHAGYLSAGTPGTSHVSTPDLCDTSVQLSGAWRTKEISIIGSVCGAPDKPGPENGTRKSDIEGLVVLGTWRRCGGLASCHAERVKADRRTAARVLAAWRRRCWRRASGSSGCRRTLGCLAHGRARGG